MLFARGQPVFLVDIVIVTHGTLTPDLLQDILPSPPLARQWENPADRGEGVGADSRGMKGEV